MQALLRTPLRTLWADSRAPIRLAAAFCRRALSVTAAKLLVPRLTHFARLSSTSEKAAVTEGEVLDAQNAWAAAITSISKSYLEKKDYIAAAGAAAAELYGYGHSKVLFKPTRAAAFPFRPTANEAMSYFVGGSVVDGGYAEDAGFAINGGKGWSDVVFTNHNIDLNGPVAIAMGTYVFTCSTTGGKSSVEYTFGYKRNDDGKVRIFLHHSSVPYSPH